MTTVLSPRVPSAAVLGQFRCRLRSMSDRPELLYDLMGFGPYREMALTRDGMLIARSRHSPGFDTFLGRISASVLQRTARLWIELSTDEKALLRCRLESQGIDPLRVGIPAEVVHGR